MLQRVEASGLLVLVAVCCALLAARLWVMGLRAPTFALADNPAAHSPSLLTRTLTFLYLPAVSVQLLVWPQLLSFDWSMDAVPRVLSLADPRNLLSLALYLGLWCCARGAWRSLQPRGPRGPLGKAPRRSRDANNNNIQESKGQCQGLEGRGGRIPLDHGEVVLAALAVLVLTTLPATNLFFYVGFVVAERILYIPSIGFCLLVAVGAHHFRLRAGRPWARRLTSLLVAATLLALSARTLLRNRDWYDEEALYRSGIPINPPKGERRETVADLRNGRDQSDGFTRPAPLQVSGLLTVHLGGDLKSLQRPAGHRRTCHPG